MSRITPEEDLATNLSVSKAVEMAYPTEVEDACQALMSRLPVLVECDKELTPYFYKVLRDRLKKEDIKCLYLDGRMRPDDDPLTMPSTLLGVILVHLREAVRGPVGERVVVLPHLDLLTTSSGALTAEAREVIPLLYENPSVLWLGFKDPSFSVPTVIKRLFPNHLSVLGTHRERLSRLVTQKESRKLGGERGLDSYALYKHVSGMNAVRLRRMLATLSGEDYPGDPKQAFDQLRTSTVGASFALPDIDLEKDIGGYDTVKERLRAEVLDLLHTKDNQETESRIKQIESLIPRGMLFCGPPGTGKTLFAKAMASALGAAVIVVSGPELKSRWVGESEENLRQIFVQARQSAPALIIFDELDSFASARGSYSGSGVEHSMVNQLLTEMDGFRSDELVFVVGTTNFAESIDQALLRPGRFEFHLQIPYPEAVDRRAILLIHDKKLELELSADALDHAVKASSNPLANGVRYSGDHLQALCRQLARRRLRENITGPTTVEHVEWAVDAYLERPELTKSEELAIATHEAGHAICSMYCEHSPPIDRISIRGDLTGTLGYVQYGESANRHVTTRQELLDQLCVLFGGREAESLLLDDVSVGAAHDIQRATFIAREMVESWGMSDDAGLQNFKKEKGQSELSERTRQKLDELVAQILWDAADRACSLLANHKSELVVLRDLLIEKKVIEASSLKTQGVN